VRSFRVSTLVILRRLSSRIRSAGRKARCGLLHSLYGDLLWKEDLPAQVGESAKGPAYWPEPHGDVQAACREIVDHVDQQYANASLAKVEAFSIKSGLLDQRKPGSRKGHVRAISFGRCNDNN
jgi:hypothetical protein